MIARSLAILTTSAVGLTSSLAVQYSDFDIVNRAASVGSPVSGTFDLTLPTPENDSATMSGYPTGGNGFYQDISGFERGMTITDASVAFWLSDPSGARERWDIVVTAADAVAISANLASGSAFSKHFQASSINNHVDLLLSIGETGRLNYSIASLSGDFLVDAAILQVNAETRNVPDGGSTAILLGLGFLGLTSLKRSSKSA